MLSERSLGIRLQKAQGLVALAYGPPDAHPPGHGNYLSSLLPSRDAATPELLQSHSPWLEARFQGSTQLGHQGFQARRR